MPGAAPAGQDLSRLQRLVPDRRRHRLDAGRDRPPEGLPDHRGAAQQAARRPAAAEISLRHPPGDAALRRARPRADALSGGAPVRRRQRLSPRLPAARAPHAHDEGGRRDRPRRPRLPRRRAGRARHAHHLVGLRDARARAVPRRRLRLQPLSRGRPLRPRRRGGGLARPAGHHRGVRRPRAVVDQVGGHAQLLRPARPPDGGARREDRVPDARPRHHRRRDAPCRR